MKIKLLSLLLVLMLLQTCGNAAIVSYFSIIQEENGGIVFMEGNEKVGYVIDDTKPNEKRIVYKDTIYFMKDARINNGILELQNKIGSIIASHILNDIFKDKEKRYPLIRLAFNPDSLNSNIDPFRILYPELEDLTSIAEIASKQPYKKTKIRVDDLENLYVGMYLIGGGDPHMHNIFYNSTNHYLGSVDLDISFKEHKSYSAQQKQNKSSSPDLFKKYSDLAIKTINCADVFSNFLFATDSRIVEKIGWDRYYDKNIPLYQENLKMNGTRLSESIDTLRSAFPDKEKLRLFVVDIVKIIKEDLKKIINEKIQLELGEVGSVFNATGKYFNKDSDAYKTRFQIISATN